MNKYALIILLTSLFCFTGSKVSSQNSNIKDSINLEIDTIEGIFVLEDGLEVSIINDIFQLRNNVVFQYCNKIDTVCYNQGVFTFIYDNDDIDNTLESEYYKIMLKNRGVDYRSYGDLLVEIKDNSFKKRKIRRRCCKRNDSIDRFYYYFKGRISFYSLGIKESYIYIPSVSCYFKSVAIPQYLIINVSQFGVVCQNSMNNNKI